MSQYDNFITQAFVGYAIPPEILRVVQPWVEDNCSDFGSAEDDLGFAELAKITSLSQGMQILQQDLKWQRAEGNRKYQQYLKDAGGRPGKGFYRYALKAYYLSTQ